MSETNTTATTGTWTEEEIRQQPASWIRSLNNIDNLRASIDNFLTPLLRKHELRIVLTGQAPRPLSATSLRLARQPHREKHYRRTDDRSGHESDGLPERRTPAAAGVVCPFRQ